MAIAGRTRTLTRSRLTIGSALGRLRIERREVERGRLARDFAEGRVVGAGQAHQLTAGRTGNVLEAGGHVGRAARRGAVQDVDDVDIDRRARRILGELLEVLGAQLTEPGARSDLRLPLR